MDRGFINVLLLGLAFMLVFTAFQTWSNIQATIIKSIQADDDNFEDANAYLSLAIIYIFMAVFNWTTPSIISLIGPKFAMLIGGVTYVLFVISFSIPHVWLLYLVSCIMGIGAAFIWTGQGNYLTLNSTDQSISRNSGVFWAMLQMSMFIGNIFVFFVFREQTIIDNNLRQIVIWTLSAIAVGGLVVMVFFPKPVQTDEKPPEEASATVTSKAILALKGAGQLFCTRNMMLLCLTFVYTGFGDACFNTQIFSMLGGDYAEDSVAAFSVFKFTQSVGAAVSLAYANYFCLYVQLGILLFFAIIGTASFVLVEWKHKREVVNAEASVSDSD